MRYLNILLVFIMGFFICFVGNAASEKEDVSMKVLKIKWQRLISKGETCIRCSLTEKEVDKAVSALKKSLPPLGIKVGLEKSELSLSEFKNDSLQSNRIWINDRSLEDWIEGKTDKSPCCDVCGPSDCRTLKVKGKVYEAIPADIIVQAGLLAAAEMVKNDQAAAPCCKPKTKPSKGKSCSN